MRVRLFTQQDSICVLDIVEIFAGICVKNYTNRRPGVVVDSGGC